MSSDKPAGLTHAFMTHMRAGSVQKPQASGTGSQLQASLHRSLQPFCKNELDTDESTQIFTVIFIHQVLYFYNYILLFFAFITNIYKDNDDGLGSDEPVGTSVHKILKPVDSF